MLNQTKDELVAVCGSMMGLSGIAVGLRLHARKRQQVPIMADDALAIAGLVSYVGAAIAVFTSVHYKTVGYPSTDFTAEELASKLELSSKLQIAWDVLSTTSLACIKLSALFFYRRIFHVGGPPQWFGIANNITIIIVVLWLVIFQFLTGFQCGTHFSALWDGTYLQYCTISFPFLYGLAVSDFLLDIWILALPIPRIMQLHTTTSRKLGIAGVFLLAFIGLGASIARMVEYIKIENGGPLYFAHHDEEEAVTTAFFFTMLETGISLVAVNLPSLWLLVTSVTPEKVIRTIRSVLSLESLRSRGSGRSGQRGCQDEDDKDRLAAGDPVLKDGSMGSTRPSESWAKLHGATPDEFMGRDLEAQKMNSLGAHAATRTTSEAMELGVYSKNTSSTYHHQP